jgi:hypothetical protein
VRVGVVCLGKSLLPEDVRGAYPVEQWNFPAWVKTLAEALREFKLHKSNALCKWQEQISNVEALPTSTRYSRMNYEQLRKIADDDILAANISNEEYEALSVAMWRKFSVENGLK